MQELAITVLVIAILYAGALLLSLPKLLNAYPVRPTSEFNNVGYFWVYRGQWRQGSGIFRFAANDEGLRITSLLPPWWRSVLIPWADIWISGLEEAGIIDARMRLEFAKLPGTQFEVRASFILRLQAAMGGKIPLGKWHGDDS